MRRFLGGALAICSLNTIFTLMVVSDNPKPYVSFMEQWIGCLMGMGLIAALLWLIYVGGRLVIDE